MQRFDRPFALPRVLRFLSRITALLSLVFLLVVFLGDGGIPQEIVAGHGIGLVLFLAAGWAGLAVGFLHPGIGAVLALGAQVALSVLHHAATGDPLAARGWFLLFFVVPGVLFLLSWAAGRWEPRGRVTAAAR